MIAVGAVCAKKIAVRGGGASSTVQEQGNS